MINVIEHKQKKSFYHLFSDSVVSNAFIFSANSSDLYEIPIEKSYLLTGKQVEIESSYYLLPIKAIKSLKEIYFFLEPERIQKGYKSYRRSNIHQKIINAYKGSIDKNEKWLGKLLDDLRKQRNDADYDEDKKITTALADRVIMKAKKILGVLGQKL